MFHVIIGSVIFIHANIDDLWKLDNGVRQVTGAQGTAGLFTTFPTSYMSTWGSLLDQVAMTFGANGGFAINPARDLGPRLFVLCAGYGWQVFSAYGFYFWIPIVGPLIGAVLGAWIYKLFVGLHGLNEELEVSSKGYNVSLPVYTSGDSHIKTRGD
ncbi:Aquaporin-9 domain protein [Trichostrongylus colubriformis]|uniref:Aquaporin-9 domain protein n=1 Tax=Trichostrongylus colubriformis TaxID=6319 RepID=A0AAN8FCB2_TRICO